LVIGDAHSHPDVSNDRFTWLANLIADTKPNVVVDIGDSADMASLFGVESGNRLPDFEQRRYREDVDVYLDSRTRLARGTKRVNGVRLVKTQGNHEHRITKWITKEPKLVGHVGLDDLQDAKFGWHLQPFLEPTHIDGVAYCHYWKRPGSDKPIGGRAHQLIQKYPGSFSRVWGHTHKFEWYEVQDGCGPKKITAVNCGMYCDPLDRAHEWAGTDVHAWRAGILVLQVHRGQILGHRWYDFHELKENYS
jgi:hypothetical protein